MLWAMMFLSDTVTYYGHAYVQNDCVYPDPIHVRGGQVRTIKKLEALIIIRLPNSSDVVYLRSVYLPAIGCRLFTGSLFT